MPDKIKGAVIGGLLLALVCSLLANMLLFTSWEAAKTKATAAETNLGTANEATKTCNDSIAGLEEAARKRGFAAGQKRALAKKAAEDLERQAQRELSTPAAVPGDDCRSAQLRVTRILSERPKP